MAIQYKPKGDRILVRRDRPVRETASGLITGLGPEEKLYSGYVVAVGTDPIIDVKIGDRILFEQHGGTPVVQDEKDHIIIDQRDVIAEIEEVAAPEA